ncbi:MAG: hypothetical protein U9N32_02355 [Spirochaetota bacterium]|nr:hypothetical protein [Spirochaetota bacterium]
MKIDSTLKKIIALLMSIAVITEIAALDDSKKSYDNEFEYRDNIAPFLSIRSIFNEPTEIEVHINPVIENGTKVLDTLFDFHAIYDIPIYKLINIVIDLENEQNVFPRMKYTRDLNPTDSLWDPHFQEVITSFKYGGLGQEYHYVFFKFPEIRKDGSFIIKWNLYESIDNKFNFSFGSWYMKEVIYEEQKYTYVRNFVHFEIVDYPAYVEIISRLLGKGDIKRFFKALQIAAE